MGNQYFRFYDVRLALAITTAGQLSIKWIENNINRYINNIIKTKDIDYVVASDTDSIYLRLSELMDKLLEGKNYSIEKRIDLMDKICEKEILPFISNSYKELSDYVNAYEQKMSMKRESLANKGIWTAKKRYVLNVYDKEGVRYKNPVLDVKGLEIVKSSTPKLVRDKLEETVKLIMNSDEKSLQKFIKNFKSEFYKLPAEEIAFPRSVNGMVKYYDKVNRFKPKTPIAVKGGLIYNELVESMNLGKKYELIKPGEKIKFIYLITPNPTKDEVISFPIRLPTEFNLSKYIDYQKQFEKTYLMPISVILNCIGWSAEKQNTLEGFM